MDSEELKALKQDAGGASAAKLGKWALALHAAALVAAFVTYASVRTESHIGIIVGGILACSFFIWSLDLTIRALARADDFFWPGLILIALAVELLVPSLLCWLDITMTRPPTAVMYGLGLPVFIPAIFIANAIGFKTAWGKVRRDEAYEISVGLLPLTAAERFRRGWWRHALVVLLTLALIVPVPLVCMCLLFGRGPSADDMQAWQIWLCRKAPDRFIAFIETRFENAGTEWGRNVHERIIAGGFLPQQRLTEIAEGNDLVHRTAAFQGLCRSWPDEAVRIGIMAGENRLKLDPVTQHEAGVFVGRHAKFELIQHFLYNDSGVPSEFRMGLILELANRGLEAASRLELIILTGSSQERWNALNALSKTASREKLLEVWPRYLAFADPQVRIDTARVTATLRDPYSFELMMICLRHEDAQIRRAMLLRVWARAWSNDDMAPQNVGALHILADQLLALLNSPDVVQRRAGVRALANMIKIPVYSTPTPGSTCTGLGDVMVSNNPEKEFPAEQKELDSVRTQAREWIKNTLEAQDPAFKSSKTPPPAQNGNTPPSQPGPNFPATAPVTPGTPKTEVQSEQKSPAPPATVSK